MRVLMIGDVVGRPGRRAVAALLPSLRTELRLDLVIANGENLAAGRGITPATAQELLAAGVDVITSGNHIWDRREVFPQLDPDGGLPLIRPHNYPPGAPGSGWIRRNGATIINLMGRVFMAPVADDPFRAADALLAEIGNDGPVILDFHAEASSEKLAIGWHLDGRVAAVVGTHTHVPTADTRVLPKGTALVCDVGMVGAKDSIIGDQVGDVLERFLTGMPNRLTVAEGPAVFNSVLIEIDPTTHLARGISRVDREY